MFRSRIVRVNTMKGIVFTEFLEMIEDKMSPDLVDQIIEETDLPSEGTYTSLGTYDHAEIVLLVKRLSERTNIPVPDLISRFGKHLFQRFAELYPEFFKDVDSSFEFFRRVHDYVHVEVKKLYPDAELPTFVCESLEPGMLIMNYHSTRPFGDLAEGLIRGCISYFNESVQVERQNLSDEPDTHVRFSLSMAA